MIDFINKPVKPNKLKYIIEKYLWFIQSERIYIYNYFYNLSILNFRMTMINHILLLNIYLVMITKIIAFDPNLSVNKNIYD